MEDTQESRDEFVKFLKSKGIYNVNASSAMMMFGHEVYFAMKEDKR